MPAERITYDNKITGGKPKTIHIQQWWFEDANEVKNSINNHADLFDGIAVVGNAFKADSFVKTGGLATEVLLADGTVTALSTIGQQTLQQVTDLGATTTNAITAGKLTVQSTVPGQKLLTLTTFGGVTILQADDNGDVWTTGVSGDANSTVYGRFSCLGNTGAGPTSYGFGSLQNNTGDRVSGFGVACLSSNQGDRATGIGRDCLRDNRGNGNTGIGDSAGWTFGSLLLGDNNTFLGFNNSHGTNSNISNATGVGANITLEKSNTVILGDNADVGIGTTNPDDSARLHVVSTTKGSIHSSLMTEAQRLAIATPATGLHVYQTDGTEGVYVNKSTGWAFAY